MKRVTSSLDVEGAGCVTPASSPIEFNAAVFHSEVPRRDPAETEDRAARVIGRFFRCLMACKARRVKAACVETYNDLRVERERAAAAAAAAAAEAKAAAAKALEAEDGYPYPRIVVPKDPAPPARVETKEEEEEEAPPVQRSMMDVEMGGCVTPASSPVGEYEMPFGFQPSPLEQEQEKPGSGSASAGSSTHTIEPKEIDTHLVSGPLAHADDDADEEEDPQQLVVPITDSGVTTASSSSSACERASSSPSSTASLPSPPRAQTASSSTGPTLAELESAARKVTNFMRQAMARRRLAELRLAHLERLAAVVEKENDMNLDVAAERIQGLYHVYAARRLLQALRTARNAHLERIQEGEADDGVPSETSSCLNSGRDPDRSTAPPEESEERGVSRNSQTRTASSQGGTNRVRLG